MEERGGGAAYDDRRVQREHEVSGCCFCFRCCCGTVSLPCSGQLVLGSLFWAKLCGNSHDRDAPMPSVASTACMHLSAH